MLESIYASKLFIRSSRKDIIKSKIESAENIELVQQLIADLDDDYKTLDKVAPELADKLTEQKEEEAENLEIDADESEMNAENTSDFSKSPSVGQRIPEEPSGNNDEEQDGSLISTDENQEKPEESRKPIKESIEVSIIPLDEIKGTLNHSSDTAGVSRIETKEKELWIYYKDDVNLNSIMTDVIELLNTSGYTYLSFNRLARSNNAIVFEVSNNTDMVGDIIE